jgi:hypothetical protein
MSEFDGARALSWMTSYLEAMISTQDDGLRTKALGEFALLLSLLHAYQESLTHQEQACLRDAHRTIEHLCDEFVVFTSASLEHCQIAHFLSRAGCTRYLDPNEICRRVAVCPPSKLISIEHAFVMEEVGLQLPVNFWKRAATALLSEVTRTGITRTWMYQLTHLVFFATQFGSRKFYLGTLLTRALRTLIHTSVEIVSKEGNFDLLAELALSAKFAHVHPKKKLYSMLRNSCGLINVHQDSAGWVISDTSMPFHSKKWNKYQEYSLFHTTTVCLLLALAFRSSYG